MRSEVAILGRTIQILDASHPLPSEVRAKEVSIEKASLEKANEDELKGASMDQLSNLVQQITEQLKGHKSRLQPMIEELRSVRTTYSAVDTRHSEMKARYEQVRGEVDLDLNRVTAECQASQDEIDQLETKYHELQSQMGYLDNRLQVVNKEGKMLRENNGQTLTAQ